MNDAEGKTLFSVQTYGKNAVGKSSNADSAKEGGVQVAKKLLDNNLKTAVFDRNGKQYTGVLAALADSIREGGVQI